METFAAIDIGSNAIRLAIAHMRQDQMVICHRAREPVRLGSSVFKSGQIDETTYQNFASAMTLFANQLENHGVKKFKAVATSAMRDAENKEMVLDRLEQDSGIRVEIISGDQEAQWVYQAIESQIDLNKNCYLLIDIGGGSIELVALDHGKILRKQSFQIGMVRVLEKQKSAKTPIESWLPEFLKKETADFFKDLPMMPKAIGTGGNMDRFLKLKPFVSLSQNNELRLSELQSLYEKLSSVPFEERIVEFCLKPDRADVILPAALATLFLMEQASSQEIVLPQVGLMDGVLRHLSQDV